MSRSWGHEVYQDVEALAHRMSLGHSCGPKCRRPKLFFVRYRYITGRAGRTSSAERAVCDIHAEKFAKKNGIQMPEKAETRLGILEAAWMMVKARVAAAELAKEGNPQGHFIDQNLESAKRARAQIDGWIQEAKREAGLQGA